MTPLTELLKYFPASMFTLIQEHSKNLPSLNMWAKYHVLYEGHPDWQPSIVLSVIYSTFLMHRPKPIKCILGSPSTLTRYFCKLETF